MKLSQRVAVITGASQGIGAACTRLFAEQGAKVVIADINETDGSALADEIVRAGGAATFRRTDVADYVRRSATLGEPHQGAHRDP